MIELNFEDALTQIFKKEVDPFINSFNIDDKKLNELEEKSKEIIDLLKVHSGTSFEDIVRNNDINSFREYIKKNEPEQIYLNDEKYGNIFIFRLISLFLEVSDEPQGKEKIAECLQHYLQKIKNPNNNKYRIQLKNILKQINDIFSNEEGQSSQDLMITAENLMKGFSS